MAPAILVCGATGKQGGALINQLIRENADFEILALTRDEKSPSAQHLVQKSPNIKLIQGDLADPTKIFDAAEAVAGGPVWGVFSVQVVMGFTSGADAEYTQGRDLVDAALKAGVKHFVYTSVDRHGDASIDNPTNVPHFISKHKIEKHLIDSTKNGEMTWTILRPVAFMENFTDNFFGRFFVTTWKMAVKEKPLQLISVDDIGAAAAQAFLRPDQWKNRAISLAGDELTIDQAGEIFKKHTGEDLPWTYQFICSLLTWAVKDMGYMFSWFYDVGYAANIEEVRKIHPGLKDFETWLVTDSQFAKKVSK